MNTTNKKEAHKYAMVCQKSAESWAFAYSSNSNIKWQADLAAKRAVDAWKQFNITA